jgi:hypothetical protein
MFDSEALDGKAWESSSRPICSQESGGSSSSLPQGHFSIPSKRHSAARAIQLFTVFVSFRPVCWNSIVPWATKAKLGMHLTLNREASSGNRSISNLRTAARRGRIAMPRNEPVEKFALANKFLEFLGIDRQGSAMPDNCALHGLLIPMPARRFGGIRRDLPLLGNAG